MTPLQKLLFPPTVRAYLEKGASLLAGPVVRLGDATSWRTAGDVLRAYGVEDRDVRSVDVLRCAPSPLDRVAIPQAGDPTTVAGYGAGYLRAGMTPVWDIAATEVPRDAEIWRIFADGHQELIGAYGGPAIGWRGSSVFAPPTSLVGPRAVWGGREWRAAWIDDSRVELVALSEVPLEGCEETRPWVFRRVVDAASCDRIFAFEFSAQWRGLPCVLLQSNTAEAAVLLRVDPEEAAQVGATVLEPGVFWHLVPSDEVSDIQAIQRELPRG
ncbi:hypothetical protein AB0870_16110 [Microbacterium proteolyticum]|uniref:hypothetical protein n=1 Tax=Microbacterium proteolyticum TaxID=1572644 RepID=UPI002415A3F0|nr:hypothetical protein [Microbacterium proteolyticum]